MRLLLGPQQRWLGHFRRRFDRWGCRKQPRVVGFMRGVISAPQQEQADRRNQIRRAVNSQNSGQAGAFVDKSDQRSRRGHSALHGDEHGGVRRDQFFPRHKFLHQRVRRGPIDRESDAQQQNHRIQFPQGQAPRIGQRRRAEHDHRARRVDRDPQIPPVHPVDQHAAERRHHQARQRHQDYDQADLDRGMRGAQDVPGHTREIHPRAEQRDQHARKRKTGIPERGTTLSSSDVG